MKYITTVDNKEHLIEILSRKKIRFDGKEYEIDFDMVSGQPVYSLLINGKSYEAFVYPEDGNWDLMLMGSLYNIQVEEERERRLRAASGGKVAERGEFHLKAPMPGLIVTIPVEEGQQVEKGDVLIVLESMKMQNELRAPRAGIIRRIRIEIGESVEQKQTLLSVE